MNKTDRLPPVHPGDVLREDFMKPFGLSAYALAKAIGSTPITISLIMRGRRAVTAEMALKLGRYFGVSPEIWLGLQRQYDLEVAERKCGEKIRRMVKEHPRVSEALVGV
jgi:addiction module HigA family antidote